MTVGETNQSRSAADLIKRDDALLPCPFCGGDGCYVRSSGIETEVYCQNCTAVGPMYVADTFNDGADDDKAIAAWNTRALPAIDPAATNTEEN